ncbi:cytochrome c-type biogenesis protein [Larsenimonas rhizosphaerae]|uniref:Cytochrome c-type biogenesis protein n=1 Tax=Larsenimonas rhizosphaerae TaxID=2944682 RepID=A0AA41ZL17_9GAMM|nr:cytochrome c-type biogenesis protein [Larsenimonas rhizosphaerae]MCX2522705.1 cytochrome c-type biogenesis protein CcmH [Larsenimonas rhizosphaerae]
MVIFLRLAAVWLALVAGQAMAADAPEQFDTPALAARYDALNDVLRCPKCENQAIGDSHSMIAADMRASVARLLREGRSDEAIRHYMVERFGDYVLYDPRLTLRTWLLWGGPLLVLAIGLAIMVGVVRARTRSRDTVSALAPEEQARLDDLLGDPPRTTNHSTDRRDPS